MENSRGNHGNEEETTDSRKLIPFYTNIIWKRFIGSFPLRDSSLFAKISNFCTRSPARSWRHKPGLPLPLPSTSFDPTTISSEASRIFEVLEDIVDHILSSLHGVQKNLRFWQSRAEGTDAQKIYFMVFERGPLAFIDGTTQLLRGYFMEGASMQQICHLAAVQIMERITILASLQHCLSTFLAQVYIEIDKFGPDLIRDPENFLPLLMMSIDGLFSKLEASIVNPNSVNQGYSSTHVDWMKPCSPLFEKLPEINCEGSKWTDCEIRDAINLIHQNLHKLDAYLSLIISKHQKPRRMTLYWFRYTCGAVGLSVCSLWLLRHSSLMGSSDIDNWIREAQESTIAFWNDHVEQPLISIRDELFETFRRRHKGVMEIEEVQLTASSLHRMLLAFTEQQRGQKLPEDASDQEMLEVVMARYEKDLMHPIQNLLGGEIARALLIQIQKLKLDIETAMLELDQILKANEINFAILAALPAFFLSLIFLMLLRAWVKQDKGAEGRGRIARLQRRLLVVDVEKKIMNLQTSLDQGQEEEAQCMFGLVLYSLDRLYRAVERHAKATGEWLSIKQDIIDLGKPGLPTAYKLTVTSRMERVYDCLLPSTRR